MNIPPDIARFVAIHFDSPLPVMRLLTGARTAAGSAPDARLLRCALWASRGNPVDLKHFLDLIRVDPRDVIVAGEYASEAGDLVRERDLSQPFR